MLTGVVRHNRGNVWTVEHSYPLNTEPRLVTLAWRVVGMRRTGPFAPALADGLEVSSVHDRDAWQAYRQGDYLILETEHNGTPREDPLPCPPIRRGIETRYHMGAWQKYLKASGWVPA